MKAFYALTKIDGRWTAHGWCHDYLPFKDEEGRPWKW